MSFANFHLWFSAALFCGVVSCAPPRPAAPPRHDVAPPAVSQPTSISRPLPGDSAVPPAPLAGGSIAVVAPQAPSVTVGPRGARETRVTYYAKRFNGRRTTSGVRYDPEKLTAASNDFPLGSRVLLINPKNQKKVVVTINDRCRKRAFPLIDLSRRAARTLGFLGKGLIRAMAVPLPAPTATP